MALISITIPCMAKDLPNFRKLLSYWSDPRLWPIRSEDHFEAIPLCVVVNKSNEELANKFKAVFSEYRNLHTIFSDCLVFDADLEGDRDLYARGATEAKGQFGNKAGPNFLFFATMRLVHSVATFTFQNEVDCYPLHAGWLSDLKALVEQRRFAWVIGSMYIGQQPIAREIQYHLNGNSIYQCGSKEFIDFIDTVWEPRLLEHINIDPNLAYDCWWAVEMTRASSIIGNTSWNIVSTYGQFFCISQFMINVLHHDSIEADISLALQMEIISRQQALFVHGHAITPLIEKFIESDATEVRDFLSVGHRVAQRKIVEAPFDVDNRIENTGVGIESDIIHLWGSPAARTNTPHLLHTPIKVQKLPIKISVESIVRSAFIGNWHVDDMSDHIWTGGAASGLNFAFCTPQTYVRIGLRGAYAPGLSMDSVMFSGYGASHVEVSPLRDGSVIFDIHGQEGFSAVSITIDALRTVNVSGDKRELAYVLYSVDISAPQDDVFV